MLKDITLGQYFPGDTLIHKLDPRTKLLCVILYIVALFNAKGPLTYGIMIAVLAVCILISRVEWKALTRGLKPVYFIVAFTAVMNMFFTMVRRWRTCGWCATSRGRASLPPCRWCCASSCSSWVRSS